MRITTVLIASFLACSTFAACGGDDTGDDDTGDGFDDRQVVEDFADVVVIPTYETLADRTVLLDDAITALADDASEENLTAAKEAWADMREPWESGEGFLFGPVSAQGWDPAMDSWPLNKNDLEAVLESDDELTQGYINSLPETQKGFHTVEYLLWGQESDKEAGDLTPRELEYLEALTAELVTITSDLEASWTEGGADSYREVFTTAGEDGNTAYPSLSSAAQEMLGGMAGICDEVANGKIADPFDARDPNLVESQYSFNSLIDFANNIRSVKNAYTAEVEIAGTSGASLSDYVAAKDADLDTRFLAELDTAIGSLDEIPAPFREAIQDDANDDVIIAAQEAIRTVQSTIEGDLTTAVLE